MSEELPILPSKTTNNLKDILIGIVSLISEEKCDFKYEVRDFQAFFHEQKQNYKVLELIVFLEQSIGYHSQDLDDAFELARCQGIVGRKYGSVQYPDIFEIYINNAQTRRQCLQRFNKEQISELTRIAKEFQKTFSV